MFSAELKESFIDRVEKLKAKFLSENFEKVH